MTPTLALHGIRIGSAGWNITRSAAERFPATGTHLQRYATCLSAVEINSSFYRPHRPQTYARWAESVPSAFRFSVKVPKEITHVLRLRGAADRVEEFMREVTALEDRLGCFLVQLPPSLEFDSKAAATFFEHLRSLFDGPIVCEPRHATWFSTTADALLRDLDVGRVAADPAPHPGAESPSGSLNAQYFRLHGSSRMYYSPYSSDFLTAFAQKLLSLRKQCDELWCIFDNTAAGFAIENALQLTDLVSARPP